MKGVEDDDSKNTDDITFSAQTGPAWAGSERDYTYDEVNTRTTVFWTVCANCRFMSMCVCNAKPFVYCLSF